jgi:hypothetical protein
MASENSFWLRYKDFCSSSSYVYIIRQFVCWYSRYLCPDNSDDSSQGFCIRPNCCQSFDIYFPRSDDLESKPQRLSVLNKRYLISWTPAAFHVATDKHSGLKKNFLEVRMLFERNLNSVPLAGSPQVVERRKAELHLSGSWLSGSPIIRNGLTLRVNLSKILQN